METYETEKRIRKTKEDIFEKVKDSIMMEEIVNEDFEKTSNTVKSPNEALDAVNDMQKLLTRSIIWKIQSQWKF